MRYVITGSAPISAEVLEMCRIAFGAHICEGYGQTECTAMATSTCPGDNSGGNCTFIFCWRHISDPVVWWRTNSNLILGEMHELEKMHSVSS